MQRPLKILLMGDYSCCQVQLAAGLRRLGHDVTLASNGTRWMNTERDIDLQRPSEGSLGGLRLWHRLRHSLRPRLRGYDIVTIHNPIFVDLRPHRVNAVFDSLLAENGGNVFMSILGNDYFYVDMCTGPDCPLRYTDFTIEGRPNAYLKSNTQKVHAWLSEPLRGQNRYIFSRIKGATSALYEYALSAKRALGPDRHAYTGLPIDLERHRLKPLPDRIDCVNIFLGRHKTRQVAKGTDILEAAARRVVDRNPGKCRLTLVEDRPYNEYCELMDQAHVVMDQIYSYTPAMNALQAMASGKVVVSGGEPDYYDFIGEKELRPIVNAVPDDFDALTDSIEALVLNPDSLRDRGLQGHEFVKKHNSADLVARRSLDFWTARI